MAETITIPSPSVFLSSPTLRPAASLPAPSKRRPSAPAKAAPTTDSSSASAVTKRKQSKSRNGCITCKAKRLKCDEVKPTCQQCARRGVDCGGYKKDFKWRPFEETSFGSNKLPLPGKQKKATAPQTQTLQPPPSRPAKDKREETPTGSEASSSTIGDPNSLPEGLVPLSQTNIQSDFVQNGLRSPDQLYVTPEENKSIFLPPDDMSFSDQFEPGSAPSTVGMFDDTDTIGTLNSMATEASSLSSGQSPRLVDLLLPGTDMNATPAEYITWRSQYPDSLYQPASYNTMMDAIDPGLGQMQEDDVEEIIRDQPFQFNFDNVNCMMRRSSPSPSSSSTSSSGSTFFSSFLREPIFDASSPEMLTRKFDRETCGILSVKDGPTENPWRTLVWPLARDSPALYHAIASMTCFHTSKTQPQLRLPGIDHMRTAVQSLATGIQNMRFDAAIATTLVLAFAESWDQHTSTGINHIKGAKILVNQALVQLRTQPNIPKEEFDRLRFLCNTWIYMDVIARLTAVDDDQSNDFDVVTSMLSFGPNQADTHLDPLMGCATSLFPILGRVANLVRRVWHSESNSPAIISQAMELKNRLEAWEPPAILEDPEDPTSPAVDSIQTAEAYRWATLLYLHQAVPEIPSLSSAELAKKVMVYLATVPPGSRATIVQIYPLLVAGCEAVGEDREWVIKRWEFMAQRMVIGTIPRCGEVTKEVWDRRDAREAEKARLKSRAKSFSLKREYKGDHSDPFGWMNGSGFGLNPKKRAAGGSTLDMPIPKASKKDKRSQSDIGGYEKLDPELTVRGPLHWVRVMQEWKWEILLG